MKDQYTVETLPEITADHFPKWEWQADGYHPNIAATFHDAGEALNRIQAAVKKMWGAPSLPAGVEKPEDVPLDIVDTVGKLFKETKWKPGVVDNKDLYLLMDVGGGVFFHRVGGEEGERNYYGFVGLVDIMRKLIKNELPWLDEKTATSEEVWNGFARLLLMANEGDLEKDLDLIFQFITGLTALTIVGLEILSESGEK